MKPGLTPAADDPPYGDFGSAGEVTDGSARASIKTFDAYLEAGSPAGPAFLFMSAFPWIRRDPLGRVGVGTDPPPSGGSA